MEEGAGALNSTAAPHPSPSIILRMLLDKTTIRGFFHSLSRKIINPLYIKQWLKFVSNVMDPKGPRFTA